MAVSTYWMLFVAFDFPPEEVSNTTLGCRMLKKKIEALKRERDTTNLFRQV
jgi:hypothetical protein